MAIQFRRFSAEFISMKCCNRVLLVALAGPLMICGCGSKKPQPVAARTAPAPKKEAVAAPSKPAPDPAWVNEIKLQGIGGTSGRRLAIINKKTVGPGDAIQVKAAGGKVVILRCIGVRDASVLVNIEGLDGERELRLN